jgi:hypothetical protein
MFLYALRVTFALGCSSPKPEAAPSGPCPMGDLDEPAEITVVGRTPDGRLEATEPGGRISLVEPPQGGQVIFVGVRARNVDGCAITVTATLRDPETRRVIGMEARPLNLVRGADGWGEIASPDDISSFANVPVCPNANATRSLHAEPYLLEVQVRDRQARTAASAITVVPFCAEEAVCPLECRAASN